MVTTKEPLKHILIPLHTKISDKEKEALFEHYNITLRELPKIFKEDPAIAHLDAKENDIIKVERVSSTAGKTIFYRGVING